MHKLLTVTAVVLCAVFSNGPSLQAGFVFDDTEAILGNNDVTGTSDLSDLLRHDFWGDDILSKRSHKSYRPITVLLFRLDSYWSGEGLNPAVFHLHNLFVYVIVCLLYREVLERISGSRETADWSAVLFAAHPIHVESVSGLVGRAELTSSVFYLSAVLMWMRSLRGGVNGTLCLVGTCLLGGLAMFSKEQGITVLGVCLLWEVLMWVKGRVKWQVCRWLVYFVSIASLMYLRWTVMAGTVPTFQESDNPASFAADWLTRSLTYNYIWALNCYILFLPHWLCFDWSMGCVPLVDTLWDARNALSSAMWLFLAILVGRGVNNMKLTAGLVAVCVPFLPATNLLFRVGFVVAERTLFLPSMSTCYLVAQGAVGVKWLRRMLPLLSLVFLIKQVIEIPKISHFLNSIYRSFTRSSDWTTEEQLYRSGLDVCPLNAKVHYNVAKVASGNVEAEQRYREAIRLFPDYDQALNNLGNLLQERGELAEAHQLLVRAVEAAPKFAAAWMNRGIVETGMRLFSQSEESFLAAIKHRNDYPDAYYNLGNLYLAEGRTELAQRTFRESIDLKFGHRGAWVNLCLSLHDSHSPDTESTMDKALSVFPSDQEFLFLKANFLGGEGRYEESELIYKQLIGLTPDVAKYHGNLGVLYHLWGRLDQSAVSYKTSLALEHDVTIQNNYNKLIQFYK